MRGDYVKPLSPFYTPKPMLPPQTDKQVDKIEAKLTKEVEIALK